jgi:hypothetical protein
VADRRLAERAKWRPYAGAAPTGQAVAATKTPRAREIAYLSRPRPLLASPVARSRARASAIAAGRVAAAQLARHRVVAASSEPRAPLCSAAPATPASASIEPR